MKDSSDRLSPLTRSLHWLVAILFIALLAAGIYMEENEVYSLYPIHKSLGIIVIVLAVARVAWRLVNGWPSTLGAPAALNLLLAKAVHWLLIIGTVMMPLSGMMMSGAGGHGLAVFGLELLAANPDPANPGQVLALNESMAGLGHTLHGLGGKLMIAAILLHIAGALKHHFVDKDATLSRMLGRPAQ